MRYRWRTAAAIGVVACVAVLTGCAAADPVPAGPTTVQLDAVNADELSTMWASWGIPLAEPKVERIAFTDPADWSYRQADCYRAAGVTVADVGGNLSVSGTVPGTPAAAEFGIPVAIFTCQAQYPRDLRLVGYLSDEQVLYMYDYFADRLAPCLRLLGFDVTPATARGTYLADVRSGNYWDPYDRSDGSPIVADPAAFAALDLHCPPLPSDPFWAYRPFGLPPS